MHGAVAMHSKTISNSGYEQSTDECCFIAKPNNEHLGRRGENRGGGGGGGGDAHCLHEAVAHVR